jgi:GNAT superfamily N-acetyltransferase
MTYIILTKDNIDTEHICCAFSDKKWLADEFDNGYIFKRLDERAKVFIEYGPAEKAWVPITAPSHLMLGCFWVSGKYKKHGHGKALLNEAIEAAQSRGKNGLVAVVGTKKFHFMSDTKWLLRQGFEVYETIASGFSLLSMSFNKSGSVHFNDSVKSGECPDKTGLVAYYTKKCPYSEYHIKNSLLSTAQKRNLPLVDSQSSIS